MNRILITYTPRFFQATLLGICALGGSLSGEENSVKTTPQSVDQVVVDVLVNNSELRFYEAQLAAAKGDLRSAGQWANPEIKGEVGRKRSTDNTGAVQGEGTTWSVAINQTFEWPGRLKLRQLISNRQVALAENSLTQFKNALAAHTRNLVYQFNAAQQKADLAAVTAKRFASLLDIAEQRKTAGVTPLLENRILEANAITYRRRASEAQKLKFSALLELNQLRGQPLTAQFNTLYVEPRFAKVPELDGLLAVARANNLDLRQRILELEQQGYRVDLARNDGIPSVTVGPYYSEEKADSKDRFFGVGISLPLPLWNRSEGKIDAETARQKQAQASIEMVQRALERHMIELVKTYETRLTEMGHWRPDAAKRFHEAAELADHHYRLGAVPISTYVEMQKQSLDALDSLLESQREAMEAVQQLELTTGTSLHLVSTKNEGLKQ